VLNSNRKLRMTEVEALTNSLTEIGKTAANLKMDVSNLQIELEGAVQRYMESILQEENFIREKLPQVDGCLHRCKALANMMVTMKKLAMVQDPNLHGPVIETTEELDTEQQSDHVQDNRRTNSDTHHLNGSQSVVFNGGISKKILRTNTATCPAWIHSWKDANNNHSPAHVLDSILDELNDLNKNVGVSGGPKECANATSKSIRSK